MTSATFKPAISSRSFSGSPAVTLRCWRRSPTKITRAPTSWATLNTEIMSRVPS